MINETVDYFKRLSGPFMKGQRAIVSGADDPIGFAIARKLSELGAFVTLCGERRWDYLEERAGELPGAYLLCRCDGREEHEVRDVIKETRARFGGVEILVNNPTLREAASIETVTESQIREAYEDAVLGALNFVRAVAPVMKHQNQGRIVNMGHFTAKSGSAAWGPHFAAARSAMLGISKELTTELFPYHITVNSVAPGVIKGCTAPHGDVNPMHVPLGREGTPEEVAAAVVFLCSVYANFITGACIDVNGGAYMD
ncbi:MAG: SDR family oxidoreductase [Lachnospiraceae bacterium]|jgi:3-oxoacyl-[acyl-carrier protein] reductase|nr:SDR family oxidoreductase [Lachnospiraceae bacterium]